MSSRYQAVFLDVGGTLVHPHPSFAEAVAHICREHGLDVRPEAVARAEQVIWSEVAEREVREGLTFSLTTETSQRFWFWVYDRLLTLVDAPRHARSALPERFYRHFTRDEAWRLFPDALPALQRLRARGLVLGVVSNWEHWLDRLLLALQATPYLDFVVSSAAAGAEKPDPRIFHAALARCGVAPERVLHVGDSLRHDVGGAQGVGITPVLVDRLGRHPDAPCLRVADLLELEGVLRNGAA